MSTTSELRKGWFRYALTQCRDNSTVAMTDDEITAEWGLVRAARLDELERENARLREALKPFGNEWQYWKDDADIAEQGYLIVGDGDGTLSPANIPVAAFQTAAALAGRGER
jgi:hypothetical protein